MEQLGKEFVVRKLIADYGDLVCSYTVGDKHQSFAAAVAYITLLLTHDKLESEGYISTYAYYITETEDDEDEEDD
jgi:hypothetical protein